MKIFFLVSSLLCAIWSSMAEEVELNPNNCGLRIDQIKPNKIVGGTEADPEDWGWQIAMYRRGAFICGGSLISNQWIVTAAHCVNTTAKASSYLIKLGVHNRNKMENWSRNALLTDVIVHEGWDRKTKKNDIALLRLTEPVEYSDQIVPICLPDDTIQFEVNSSSWATGWGATKENGQASDILMQVELPILSEDACNEKNRGRVSYDNQICSGSPYGGQDSCQGDSGGPLVQQDSQSTKWYLAGITSWGYGCQGGGVYTRTSAYLNWITEIIGDYDNTTSSE